MEGELRKKLIMELIHLAEALWRPATSSSCIILVAKLHPGIAICSHHLIALDQVLNICLDLGRCDGGTVLQHKLPQHLDVAAVKPNLVNPVNNVLLQLGKAVLYHLVEVRAVGWVLEEGLRVPKDVLRVLNAMDGRIVHADQVVAAIGADQQLL